MPVTGGGGRRSVYDAELGAAGPRPPGAPRVALAVALAAQGPGRERGAKRQKCILTVPDRIELSTSRSRWQHLLLVC